MESDSHSFSGIANILTLNLSVGYSVCFTIILHFIHKHICIQIYIFIFIEYSILLKLCLIIQWGHERVQSSTWEHLAMD